MAVPRIKPIRNCLYGRHIGCTRRHSYQPVSRVLAGAQAALAFRRDASGCAARAHIVERTSGDNCMQVIKSASARVQEGCVRSRGARSHC